MSIAFVNGVTGYGDEISSLSTDAGNHTSENLNCVIVGYGHSSDLAHVNSIFDTAENTYTFVKRKSRFVDSVNQYIMVELWYAKNISGDAANIITVNFSADVRYPSAHVLQYSGCDQSSPLDVSSDGEGYSYSQVTTPVNTGFTNEVIVAGYYEMWNGTFTSGLGFTIRANTVFCASEDEIVAVIDSYGSAMNYDGLTDYVAVHATFKPSSETPPPPPPLISPTAGFLFDLKTREFVDLDFAYNGGYHDPATGSLYLASEEDIYSFNEGDPRRILNFKTKRNKFPKTSFGVIKVLADLYPVVIDIIYPKIPYTISVSVSSENPQRLPKFLVDSAEIRVYGTSEVTAVFLASTLEELPL